MLSLSSAPEPYFKRSNIMNYLTEYFKSPPQQKTDDQIKEEQYQKTLQHENLDLDPMLAVIRLALTSLIAVDYPKGGIRIGIRAQDIHIECPGGIQIAKRIWYQEDRTQLLSLRKHLVKALKWFAPWKKENSSVKIIFEKAIKGLEELQKTYIEKDEHLQIEHDFTGRGIGDDIELIKTCIGDTEDKILQCLKEANANYFKLSDISLTEKQTHDQYLSEKVTLYWKDKLTLLSDLFNANQIKSIKTFDLVKNSPKNFSEILKNYPKPIKY